MVYYLYEKLLIKNKEEKWVGMRRYYYPKSDEDLREILDFINEKYNEDVERLSMRKVIDVLKKY